MKRRGRRRVDLAQRFWTKTKRAPSGCLEWTAGKSKTGYGTIGVGIATRTARAHRIAWQLTYGDIPPGLRVCHHCDNRLCVEPSHLFLGTARDNTRDMHAKKRHPSSPGRMDQHPFQIEIHLVSPGSGFTPWVSEEFAKQWTARNIEMCRSFLDS